MSIGAWASIAVIFAFVLLGLWKRVNLYLLLSAAFIVVFVICVLTAVVIPHVYTSAAFRDLGFMPGDLTNASRAYTIVTSMFLHADLAHLLFNTLALVFIGSLIEERTGTLSFFLLFIATGMLATLSFAVLYLGSSYILVGASGAISGLLGALARLYPRERMSVFIGFGVTPPLPAYLLVVIFLSIETLLALMRNDNVAHVAHIGGAVFGFVLAPLIARIKARDAGRKADLQALRVLAVTPELREMLEQAEAQEDAMARMAWLERFASRASCPKCGSRLEGKRGALRCIACGWKMRYR